MLSNVIIILGFISAAIGIIIATALSIMHVQKHGYIQHVAERLDPKGTKLLRISLTLIVLGMSVVLLGIILNLSLAK